MDDSARKRKGEEWWRFLSKSPHPFYFRKYLSAGVLLTNSSTDRSKRDVTQFRENFFLRLSPRHEVYIHPVSAEVLGEGKRAKLSSSSIVHSTREFGRWWGAEVSTRQEKKEWMARTVSSMQTRNSLSPVKMKGRETKRMTRLNGAWKEERSW